MIFFLNATDREHVTLGTIKQGHFLVQNDFKLNPRETDKLLVLIDKYWRKNRLTAKNIHGVMIVTGVGSFTGIRFSVTFANTLGWLYGLPVMSVKPAMLEKPILFDRAVKKLTNIKTFKPLKPVYDREPNIT